MTDLDELREKWSEHDRRLDSLLHLNGRLLIATNLNHARSAMRRLAAALAFEAVVQLAAVVALGSFLAAHITQLRFALPAAVLQVMSIALLVVLVRQVVLALGIDYGRPIASLQRDLGTLRIVRIRYIQWILLTSVAVWTPLLIVLFEGIFGLDAYRLFGAAYLAANLLLGLALIPLGVWASKRFGPRLGRIPIVRRIVDSLSGSSMKSAAAFLASLSEFADENAGR